MINLLRLLRLLLGPVYRLMLKPSRRYSLIDVINFPFNYTSWEEMIKNAMEFAKASKLDGDYLEFGVYGGKTFTAAFHFAKKNNLKSMKFYAFDSFQGLPKIKGIDAEFKHFNEGQYACSFDEFKSTILKNGVDLNRVRIVSGWYSEVLNEKTKKKLDIKSASVILIDCDIYESTVSVLDFITDYLVNGTILIFDDWFCFRGSPSKGEQRAFREWLKKHPKIKVTEFYRFGWNGNSFIVHTD